MAGLGQGHGPNSTDLFDTYFRRADLDGDGRINGAEAVAFFQGANLPKNVLAQVWMHADQNRTGFLGRSEFYNALKLVTVAQSKRELTPDIVKAALYGPAAAKIPAPQINLAATSSPQLNSKSAAPVPQLGSATPAASQNIAVRGPQVPANASINPQFVSSQQNQFTRLPQGMPPGIASHSQQGVASQGISGGPTVVASHPHSSNMSTDWLDGKMGARSLGGTSQIPSKGISPSTTQDGVGLVSSTLSPSVQPKPLAATGMTSAAPKPPDSAPSLQMAAKKTSVSSGNGFASDSIFGDVFSDIMSRSKQDSPAPSVSVGSTPVPPVSAPVSTGPQPSSNTSLSEVSQSPFIAQRSVADQIPQAQSTAKQNQQVSPQSSTAFTSAGSPLGDGNSSSSQSPLQWPRMTQSDVQKYTKVFVEVDTDRDGKITGEQARNLFLSWRLPREVLRQVWDLSDQDNDSMLSLREFCTALYLMERYREGRPLPNMLPSNIMYDETLLRITGQPTAAYGSAVVGPSPGLQQSQGMAGAQSVTPSAGLRSPRQVSSPAADVSVPQKSRVPVLEKHLVDQLSKDEQSSLNSKLLEATDADKKVEELEKEILDSKEKIGFYRTKMQELILYKSRCDNRLNEVTERASADKREVESLVKKYEQKYKQVGDVASKLTTDEATFRDIQERKLELYQALVKMDQGSNADGIRQDHVDRIQTDLDDLIKALNERCKKYALRVKPTTLVELPFGWQPGIQEGAADWDKDWGKFEDEGFTFVKELTLDVQNVVAPPKPWSSLVQKGTTHVDDGLTAASSLTADSKSEKQPSKGERMPENESADAQGENGSSKSPPDSPAERKALESPSREFPESQRTNNIETDGSPHVRDTHSDHGGTESVLSGDKGFDEPSWGAFDMHDDTDSVWGFNPSRTKDVDHERLGENSFFGSGDFGLNPIRTNSFLTEDTLPKKSSFAFADSVPSTPLFNSGNSPLSYSETTEEQSFNNFSRFDSFGMHDSGFFPPHDSLARFDSIRSSRESEQGRGFPSFDDADPFGPTGLFKTSTESQTPRRNSDNWSAF